MRSSLKKTFEDYAMDGVLAALAVVEQATGESNVHAIGYCVGGTLLAATLAYMANRGDHRITSATFFAAQVDFTHAGDLMVFVDEEQIEALEKRMAERGYLEGSKMANAFNLLAVERPDLALHHQQLPQRQGADAVRSACTGIRTPRACRRPTTPSICAAAISQQAVQRQHGDRRQSSSI